MRLFGWFLLAICWLQGDGVGAKRVTQAALAMVLASQGAVGLLAYEWRNELVGLLTSQQDVLALTAQAMPVLALCFMCE